MTAACPLCRQPAEASVVRMGGHDVTVIGCPCVTAERFVVFRPLLPAAAVETIEVPVTRHARVTKVSRADLREGDQVAMRPAGSGRFRCGIARVGPDGQIERGAIAAACEDDDVYRVEPPP